MYNIDEEIKTIDVEFRFNYIWVSGISTKTMKYAIIS